MSAYPQFGPSPTLTAPQLLSTGGSRPGSGGGGGSGSPDPVNRTAAMMSAGSMAGANPALATAAATTQSPYSPYSPHGTTALLHAYGRLPAGFAEGMYGAAAAAAAAAAAGLAPPPSAAQGLYQLGADPAAFYVNPITGTPYDLKDNAEIWRNLAQPGACLSYDPTGLGYGYGYGGIDLSLAARRKNATKENTSTLKAWLQEHKKNPYPTKGEKIMLAIITKMTLTQVSTWFANARRRLKKENKMTWSPKSKDGEHSDDDADADNNGEVNCRDSDDDGHGDDDGDNNNKETNVDILGCDSDDDDDDHNRRMTPDHHSRLLNDANHQRHLQGQSHSPQDGSHKSSLNSTSEGGDSDAKTSDNGKESGVTNPRPRIWSLDDVLGETRSISPNAPSADASVTSGLSYPLPLKPTATSLGGLQHTAASLRHWAERSPYPIPVSLAHYGIPTSLNLSTGVPTISTPGRPVFSATSLAGLNSATGVPHPGSGHPAFQPHSGHYPHNLSSHPSSHPHPHHPHHPHHHPGAGPLGSLATHPAASGSLLATVPNHISKSPDSSTISHPQASRHNIGDRELPKYTLDSRGLPVTSHSSPESLTAFRPVARSKPSEVIKA